MAFEPDFLQFASTSVKVEPLSTHNAYGAPAYGAASTYKAYVEYVQRLVVGPDGREQVSRATVYVMSSSANISPQDRITLSGETPRILSVDRLYDDEGVHHTEISVG